MAIAARDGEVYRGRPPRVSIRQLHHGLWAAIRAELARGLQRRGGPLQGFSGTPDEIARSVESAKEAIHQAAATQVHHRRFGAHFGGRYQASAGQDNSVVEEI
jgi:hypothetical protein